MKYGSVCSGIEAATVAWHPLGWTPAFYSEIDPFARAVLSHHYPDPPLHGDFTTIGSDDYGPIDLLVGGTPCQSFSIAGLRGGLDDDRGNLSLEFLRLADRKRPRWLVWENVPGVFSSVSHPAPDPCPPPNPVDLECDGQEVDTEDDYLSEEVHAFNCFLAGLSELGYGIAYRVLDAQYVRVDGYPRAVPQRRRRVFVIGYLGDWRRAAAVLFERESLHGYPAPRRKAGEKIAPATSPCLRARGNASHRLDSDAYVACVAPALDSGLVTNSGNVGYCLTASAQQSLDAETETLIAHTLSGEGFDAGEDGTGRGTPIVPVCFNSREDPEVTNDRAGSLSASLPQSQAVAHNWTVRRLMPVECERLQGFPDGYTDVPYRGKPKSADGPRYKAIGNSMAVNVMRWIGRRISMVEELCS